MQCSVMIRLYQTYEVCELMQKSIAIGVSMTKDLLSKIDLERGDVSRSRYLQKIVEKAYAVKPLGDKEVAIS
jgi:hypothetical protein